jgi:hypothetical protein
MTDQPTDARRPEVVSVRSYSTHFELDEDPIPEGGVWLNGRKDGIDWTDVVAKNRVAYGAVTRMGVAERRAEQGNLESPTPEGPTRTELTLRAGSSTRLELT